MFLMLSMVILGIYIVSVCIKVFTADQMPFIVHFYGFKFYTKLCDIWRKSDALLNILARIIALVVHNISRSVSRQKN